MKNISRIKTKIYVVEKENNFFFAGAKKKAFIFTKSKNMYKQVLYLEVEV